MASVSVIVPVYDGGEAFLQCLRSLSSGITDVDEIIVVADGETDGAWRHAHAYGAHVVVNVTSKGPSFARNLGAQAASGDILLFIDADVVVRPETIGLIREAFLDEPDVAAVFGSYDDQPAARSFLSTYRNLLHHFTHQHGREDAATFWAACGAIRREVFRESGGFDERYEKPCVEDIELGYRLRKAGHCIRLRKDIQVKHIKQWSARDMVRTDIFLRAVPWTQLLLSYRMLRNDLNLRVENQLSVLALFCCLGAVVMSFGFPALLPLAGALAALLIVLNAPFYTFLLRRHGMSFALRAIPWHWLFYACSGAGFLLGTYRFGRQRWVPKTNALQTEKKSSAEISDVRTNATWAEARV